MAADFSAQRSRMIEGQLRTTDVTNVALLDAVRQTPREEFVSEKLRSLAYSDEDLEVAAASGDRDRRYLMEPSPFGKMAQLAEISSSDFVLDIGCATGYSSAVFSLLASSVIALECDPALCEAASSTLSDLGYDNVAVVEGPLADGYEAEAPYDVIFVGGAVEFVPDALLRQMKDGGRLVAIRGFGNAGFAELYVKDDGVVSSRRAFNASVKPLPGFRREQTFVF